MASASSTTNSSLNGNHAKSDDTTHVMPVSKSTWMGIADHAYTESSSVVEAVTRMRICFCPQNAFEAENPLHPTSDWAESESAGLERMEAWPSSVLKEAIALQHEDPNVQENVKSQIERVEKLLDRLEDFGEM